MCESCNGGISRRDFVLAGGALGAAALWAKGAMAQQADKPVLAPRQKKPAKVAVVFLYPPADVVYAGKNEDGWARHQWFTWPGNQFEPEAQQAKFTQQIKSIVQRLGMEALFHPQPIYQQAKVAEFIAQAKAAQVDAVVVVNFWNTFAGRSYEIATQAAPKAIVYQPVGSNHQLPSESLRKDPNIFFIHSIENWAEIERGLRAVRAAKMMAQSRLLRISGRVKEMREAEDADLGTHIVGVPTAEYNALFDSIEPDDEIVSLAKQIARQANEVRDISDEYLVDAIRAHRTVSGMMRRYGADAVTIECLFLKHRKPCVSFAIHNSELVPCGCENQLDGTLTQMLGRWLWDRAGFMHNPEFDTSENRYFGAHCTCALKLHGPDGPSQPFILREKVMLAKYYSGKKRICCWTGTVVESPTCPPAGGCATRVLVDIDRVEDVCSIYPGPHPILFCGDKGDARTLKVFARLYGMECVGNV